MQVFFVRARTNGFPPPAENGSRRGDMQDGQLEDADFNYWGGDEPYLGDWENDGLWGTHLEWTAYGLHAKPEHPPDR